MSGANYSAWDIQTLPAGQVDKKAFYRNLVGWAVLAANSHNSQPWRFRVSLAENRVDILVPKAGVLPASDKNARQAQISVGCAMANMFLAAQGYGVDSAEMDFSGMGPDQAGSVKMDFSGVIKEVRPSVFAAMKNRRMNRGKYSPAQPVPEATIEALKQFDRNLFRDEGLSLHFIQDNPTRFAIAEIQYLADRAVVARNDFRAELGNYFLPNDSSEAIGMPGSTFGLSDAMTARMRDELKKVGSFDPDLAHGFAAADRDGIKSAPLIVVVSAKSDSLESRVKAGMIFGMSCIAAEHFGLAVAVHAAIVEVTAFRAMLKLRLGAIGSVPLVLFRMGYPTEQRPHSPRASVDSVLEFV